MDEQEIIETALANLKEHTGIKGKFIPPMDRHMGDGEVELGLVETRQRLAVEIKGEVKPYQLPNIIKKATGKPFLLVAQKLYGATKAALREKKINYLDMAGNIYYKHGLYLIQVDGNKTGDERKVATNRAFTKTGLKTVFYFLLDEHALNKPYRETALMTGVALGNIGKIVEGLKEAGFILQMTDRTCMLKNKKGLLDRWIAGYRETLKPNLHIGNFKLPPDTTTATLQDRIGRDAKNALGGEPAAEIMTGHLRPEIYTFYTELTKPELIKGARLIPDPNGKLQVFKKFWKTDYPVTMDAYIAHPLLIYADLVITDDPRCIETAQIIYDQYLKYEFEQR